MGFYPEGMETGKTKLPIGKNFGRIKLEECLSYFHDIKFSSHIDTGGEPILFIDLEQGREEYKRHKANIICIHFGICAKFIRLPNKGNPKPHIDIYIPISELNNLIESLQKIQKDNGGEPNGNCEMRQQKL